MKARRAPVLLAAALLGACVPYPKDADDDDGGSSAGPAISGAYPDLGQGASEVTSPHFKVSAYGADAAQSLSDAAEQGYAQLMNDWGLVTFMPKERCRVLVYGSQDEYRKKTGQPDWSVGVVSGGTIYTYYSDRTAGVLSHLMTHALWREFMGGRVTDQQRWVEEGLAVYEEGKTEGRRMFETFRPMLANSPIPMDQLQNLAPADERSYDTALWYAEAQGLVRFLIERGGRINFSKFATNLQMGQAFDASINGAFPGQWRTLADAAADWQRSLQ